METCTIYDLDKPPDLPVFRSNGEKVTLTCTPKKIQHEAALSDAVTGAAIAVCQYLNKSSNIQSTSKPPHPHAAIGVSPGKAVELHMKNFERFCYLQQQYKDGILTTKEFEEQKEKILLSLRKVN